MKAIISFLLLILTLLLNLQAQQPLPCTQVSVQDLNGPQPYITGACLEVSSNLHIAAKNVKMEADQRIHFAPGSKISPNQNGHFQASIRPNAMKVVWIEPGTPGVAEQYKKMELGVRLNSQFEAFIDEFLLVNESDVAPRTNPSLNPFDPDEVELFADFYYLEGPMWQQQIPRRQYGFFYENFDRVVGIDPAYSEWIPITTDYRFRIRFAPRYLGKWRCRVGVNINISNQYELADFEFNVIPSDGHDFVRVGNSKRYLTIEDKTFFPVGMNLTDQYCYYNADNNFDPYGCSTYPDYLNGGQNPDGAGPKVYEVFHRELDAFANAGANYFKMDILPWFSEIEFEKLANYNDRMNRAWELDKIVEHAEQRDVFIHFNTQIQYALCEVGCFSLFYWDWLGYDQYPANFPIECTTLETDGGYCYNKDLGLSSCNSFFSDVEARHYYKNRLRYLIARYGYSTNIAVFETFNEIDGTCSFAEYEYNPPNSVTRDGPSCSSIDGTNFIPYYHSPDSNIIRNTIEDWQQDIHYYMNRFMGDNQHIQSVNYLTDGPLDPDNTYNISYLDMVTKQNYWVFPGSHDHSRDLADDIHSNYDMPFTNGEVGSGSNYKLCDNDASWIRDLWLGAFTGMCTAPLLWENQHRQDLWIHFGRLNSFVSGYDFNEDGGWTAYHDYDETHSGSGVDKYGVSDLFYLRSPSREEAIGVIGNRTYNFFSQWECSSFPFDTLTLDGYDAYNEFLSSYNINSEDDSLYYCPRVSQYQDEHLHVKNLKGYPTKRYVIEYSSVWNPGVIIKTEVKRNDNWNGLKLEFPATTGTSVRPIVLVKVYPYKNKSSEVPEILLSDSLVNAEFLYPWNLGIENPWQKEDVKVYPNPFNSNLKIKLPSTEINSIIMVYDLSGRTLMQIETSENITSLDLSSLQPGTYILAVLMDGDLSHFKIIKQ
jgi:hypothetical protein